MRRVKEIAARLSAQAGPGGVDAGKRKSRWEGDEGKSFFPLEVCLFDVKLLSFFENPSPHTSLRSNGVRSRD